jgi:hypothetical protein
MILRKLVLCQMAALLPRQIHSTYYAFAGVLAPKPTGMVPAALFPFAKMPCVVMGYSWICALRQHLANIFYMISVSSPFDATYN